MTRSAAPDLFSVTARKALVVGGTRGIGRAIAWRLAEAGAHVTANYVREQRPADELAREAANAGLQVNTIRADVASRKGLDLLLEGVGAEPPSILVFAAATGVHKELSQLTTRHWDWTFSLNARAFFELVQRLSPGMAAGSTIVAVSSEGAVRAVPNYALVGASKGALESLARHMAAELAPRGIRVNILSPGSVVTDSWKTIPDAERRLAADAQRSMLRRLTTSAEVAWAAHFLCSNASSGLVGHTLVVDGGARLRG